MKLPALIFSALSLLLLGGCSKYKVVHIGKNNPDEEGIRYWRPAPYLLVSDGASTTNSAGITIPATPKAEIIYLPDPAECYAIQSQGFWGSATTSVKLVNGWRLDDFNNTNDSKIPETIKETGLLLTTILGAVKGQSLAATEESNLIALKPGLYRINLGNSLTFTRVKLQLATDTL